MQSPDESLRQLEEAVQDVRFRLDTSSPPLFGLILGTGLGGLVDQLQVKLSIPYAEIPHFPRSSVESHAGQLVFGTLAGKSVVVMQGRVHAYEGVPVEQIAFPIRLLRQLGVQTLLITNAAGGLNPLFQAGDIMAVTDHINFMGRNPLVGPNLDPLGDRFPDMTRVYDQALLGLAAQAALDERIQLMRGVYVGVLGPSMETPAETRMLRLLGADAVGMSTIPEAITAVHCGMRLLVISAITNVNRPDCMEPAPLETIIANAAAAGKKIIRVLEGTLQLIPGDL